MNKTLLILTTIFLASIYDSKAVILFTEDFNSPTALNNWTVNSSGLVSQTWNIQAKWYSFDFDGTPLAACWDYSGNKTNEGLVSPVIPVSSSTPAYLSYDYTFVSQGTELYGIVEVYDGTAWQTLKTYYYKDLYKQHEKIDVTAYANSNFQVRFKFVNATGNKWEHTFLIDNVVVEGEIPTSISNLSKEKISAYPTPFENQVYLTGVDANTTVIVLDSFGKIVYSNPFNNSLDLSFLTSGVYFIKAEDQTLRIVKK